MATIFGGLPFSISVGLPLCPSVPKVQIIASPLKITMVEVILFNKIVLAPIRITLLCKASRKKSSGAGRKSAYQLVKY